VRQALDIGITTFDTAGAYADTRAESVLGQTLKSERRGGLEIFTKAYFPLNQPGQNDDGLSRKHIHESINGSLRRLGTDYVDLFRRIASTTRHLLRRPFRRLPTLFVRAKLCTSASRSGTRPSYGKDTVSPTSCGSPLSPTNLSATGCSESSKTS